MDSSIGDREQTGYIEEGELAIEFGFSRAVLTRSVAHRKSQATGPHDSQIPVLGNATLASQVALRVGFSSCVFIPRPSAGRPI